MSYPTQNFRKAKILISYVTAGTGHRRAAEAVAEAVRQRLPHAELICVDLLSDVPPWLHWIYPRLYRVLVGHLPSWWGFVYAALDRPRVFRALQPWRRRWNRLVARRFVERVSRMQPDVVVATHFFPADVLGQAKRAGWLQARLVVVITDLFPHRFWLVPEADAFAVGSEDTRAVCQDRGVERDRVHVVGIPIRPSFAQAADRPTLCDRLGLDPSRRTLLIVSGGMGVGPIEQLTTRVAALEATRPRRLQVVVVCGQNQGLQQRLERLQRATAMPVRVFGFVDTMPELMHASDLLITKAGGLTIMEALAVGLPMILCGTIPGQERLNADYVARHGAGVNARAAEDAVAAVVRLLDHPEELEAMRAKARALGRPRAAMELVERLIVLT